MMVKDNPNLLFPTASNSVRARSEYKYKEVNLKRELALLVSQSYLHLAFIFLRYNGNRGTHAHIACRRRTPHFCLRQAWS